MSKWAVWSVGPLRASDICIQGKQEPGVAGTALGCDLDWNMDHGTCSPGYLKTAVQAAAKRGTSACVHWCTHPALLWDPEPASKCYNFVSNTLKLFHHVAVACLSLFAPC